MSDSVLKKFGKYFLLDRIGEGGMAEIFRARLATPDSSGRFIVIKRIQGAYSNNEEFVQMFKSEVQVTMRFTHPNIVQLYESGEENKQQFIAMELVEGRNLRQILSKVTQKQQRVPIAAACQIVEQAAAGLHYAHGFKDRITGEPLNLVHRDVSPQNILVSYDGNIKVIDFGIAKAATSGEATRAGVIKGKLSYLSPEQVMGDVLDGRSDLFALGIVLWELLVGKRLFVAEGDNEFQVLKMIESCNSYVKPPSTFNPEIPKELDAVVMQALTRDLKKRFSNGDEFSRALRKVLSQHYSDFGSSDLSTFIKKLFHDLIVEDRKQLQQLNAKAEELIALGVQAPAPERPSVAPPPKDQTRIANLGNKFERSQLATADRLELAAQPERQLKVPAANRSNPQSGSPSGRSSPGVNRNAPSSTRSGTTQPRIPQPVRESGGGIFSIFKFLTLTGMAAGAFYFYNTQFLVRKDPELERSPATQAPSAAPVQASKGAMMRVRIFPDGNLSKTRVLLNSNPVDLAQGAQAPIGEPLELVVDRPGFVSYRKEFTIKDSDLQENREYPVDVKLEPMVYGTFTLSTVPELADVKIVSLDQGAGGVQRAVVLKTPVYQEKLAVGRYKVLVKNEILNVERVFQIEVNEGDRIVKSGITLEPVRSPAGNH